MFQALAEPNQKWCKKADTLVVVISRNNFEHNNKPAVTAQFDSGAAWMSLALEAHAREIVAHGMQGFNYEAIKKDLQIPDSFTVEAMIAIGKKGNSSDLPPELREKEVPSTRKPLKDIISRGSFPFQ